MKSKNPRDPGDSQSPSGDAREARDKLPLPYADGPGPPPPEDDSLRARILAAFSGHTRTLAGNLALYILSLFPPDDRELVNRVRDFRDTLMIAVLSHADDLAAQRRLPPPDSADPSQAAAAPLPRVTIAWLLKQAVRLCRQYQQEGEWDRGQPLPLPDDGTIAGLRAFGVGDRVLEDAQRQLLRERAMDEYFYALGEGDLDTLEMLIERAETDRVLEHMLFSLDAQILEEELGIDLVALERALRTPDHAPAATGTLADEQAPSAPYDASSDELTGSRSDDIVAALRDIVKKTISLYAEDLAATGSPIDLRAPVAEDVAPASRASASSWLPRVTSPGKISSSLHVPDAPQWAVEHEYSSAVARALVRAYAALTRAPGMLRAYADAYHALAEWERSPMSARQHTHVEFVMGMCYAAIGKYLTALAYLDEAYWDARWLRDWGGAAECAHLAALISAALGDCATAAEYLSMCLDCLDHY